MMAELVLMMVLSVDCSIAEVLVMVGVIVQLLLVLLEEVVQVVAELVLMVMVVLVEDCRRSGTGGAGIDGCDGADIGAADENGSPQGDRAGANGSGFADDVLMVDNGSCDRVCW